ncbi:MAG: beta strand repeat-containing protein, partial [Planctomycetota bacterium]
RFAGGAIANVRSDIIVDVSRFEGNLATTIRDGFGGAIANLGGSTPVISESIFLANRAFTGGALANAAGAAPLIQNCTFDDNVAADQTGGAGGAILNIRNVVASVEDCVFNRNSAWTGGAIASVDGSSIDIAGSTLTGNNAGAFSGAGGGALYNENADAVSVNATLFESNSGFAAGAVFNINPATTATFTDVDFLLNSGTASSSRGGGAVLNRDAADVRFLRTTFAGNTAYSGGAVRNENSTVSVTDSVFSENEAANFEGGNGGALANTGGSMASIANSNLDLNKAFRGGAVYGGSSSTLSIDSGSRLQSNEARGGSRATGGAIHIDSGAVAMLDGLTIDLNIAPVGGAVAIDSAELDAIATTLESNSASTSVGGSAGAISAVNSATVRLDACTVSGNQAYAGGGMRLTTGSTAVISNTLLSDNTAANAGGAIWASDATLTLDAATVSRNSTGTSFDSVGGGLALFNSGQWVVRNSRIESNSAYLGGGIYVAGLGSDLSVSDTMLLANTATSGFLSAGGALTVDGVLSATVDSCNIIGNQANTAGGISVRDAMMNIVNSAFIGNAATANNSRGGAMRVENSTLDVLHSTIADNTADLVSGLIFESEGQAGPSTATLTNSILYNGGNEVGIADASTVTITWSNVEGGYIGSGNISEDPKFSDLNGPDDVIGTADDVVFLAGDSPCIDAASSTVLPPELTTDLYGQARRIDDPLIPDTGFGPPPLPDMGASEFDGGSAGITDMFLSVMPVPLEPGREAEMEVTGALPGERVTIAASPFGLGRTPFIQYNVVLDLRQAQIIVPPVTADGSGRAQWSVQVRGELSGYRIWFQAMHDRAKSDVVVSRVR